MWGCSRRSLSPLTAGSRLRGGLGTRVHVPESPRQEEAGGRARASLDSAVGALRKGCAFGHGGRMPEPPPGLQDRRRMA